MEDEIREEKLDSPLVVHKKDDASYQESAAQIDMSATHNDDSDMPTLERHRFRKEKKSNHAVWVILAMAAVAVAVALALVYSGRIPIGQKEESTIPPRTYITEQQNNFKSIITVKGTYIFYEGVEVDGLGGLESEIKYLDENTKITVQDEDANSDFLNLNVLSLLSQYKIDYEITHIVSSGLYSKYESTTAVPSSSKAAATTAASNPTAQSTSDSE